MSVTLSGSVSSGFTMAATTVYASSMVPVAGSEYPATMEKPSLTPPSAGRTVTSSVRAVSPSRSSLMVYVTVYTFASPTVGRSVSSAVVPSSTKLRRSAGKAVSISTVIGSSLASVTPSRRSTTASSSSRSVIGSGVGASGGKFSPSCTETASTAVAVPSSSPSSAVKVNSTGSSWASPTAGVHANVKFSSSTFVMDAPSGLGSTVRSNSSPLGSVTPIFTSRSCSSVAACERMSPNTGGSFGASATVATISASTLRSPVSVADSVKVKSSVPMGASKSSVSSGPSSPSTRSKRTHSGTPEAPRVTVSPSTSLPFTR